jgi:hypothetical protein
LFAEVFGGEVEACELVKVQVALEAVFDPIPVWTLGVRPDETREFRVKVSVGWALRRSDDASLKEFQTITVRVGWVGAALGLETV